MLTTNRTLRALQRRGYARMSESFLGSGRSAAWLARFLGVEEVPSSNLGGPTKFSLQP